MHIAIDIDGTLTEHPKKFLELMLALKSKHRITILTGTLGQSVQDHRVNQLALIGIASSTYDSLVIYSDTTTDGVAVKKGEFCRDQKVDMIFEDTPMYLQAVSRISPNTCCSLIFK